MHMLIFEYLLILLAAVLLSNLINRFIPSISVPIIQIILGVIVELIPFGAFGFRFELEPELFFSLFIALLVFNSSMTTNKKTFWELRKPIINMAIVLVILTVVTVGGFVHFLIPAIPFAAAFALIGALAPTDIVAVDAVTKRVGVPAKIMGILTGESIVNDATGIVCFQFALVAMMTGSFSIFGASVRFLFLGLGGILTGLVFTGIKYIFIKWIRSLGMENVTLHILIEILTPLILYMLAEALSVSGILAVFASGMIHSFLRDKFNPETVSLNTASDSVWSVLSFTLDGLVFVILGIQLPGILKTASSASFPITWWQIVGCVFLITLAILLLRFVWWMLTIHKKVYEDSEQTISKVRAGIIFSLSGARGTVTLATVLSIPQFLKDEIAFPQQDLSVLLCVGVIVLTLLITNFILPLFAEKKEQKVSNHNDSLVYAEILQGVIIELDRQAEPDNYEATNAVVRSYFTRSTELLRKHVTTKQENEYEKKLRLEVLQWEKDNTLRMLSEGEIDDATASRYIELVEVRAQQSTSGRKVNLGRMLMWFMKSISLRMSKKDIRPPQNFDFTIVEKNGQYVLDKLYDLRKSDEDIVVSKLISEYEMSLLLRKSMNNRNNEKPSAAADHDSIFEVVSRGFQIERDLIQQMFEAGRISREAVKEMRSNIAALESQLK